MARDLILAIDAGTSVIKVLAFDLDGKEVASAARPNTYRTGPGGAVDQDMARTWRDTVAVLRELTESNEGVASRAAALAVTGQGDGTWLVDRDGVPVAPAWLWLDSRAAGIVEEKDTSGIRHRMYQHTGCGLNACNQTSQLAWMERHTPEVLDRAATAQHCKDWLYLNLTGRRATDVTEGVFTFGDFRTRRYVPEILDWMEIAKRRHLLPELVDGTRVTHGLTETAAKETGLPSGLPVSLGSVDVACSALGGGLYDPGRNVGCSIVGSTGMNMRFVPNASDVTLAPEPGGYTMAFPVDGAIAQMQSTMAATINIDWIVEVGRDAARALGHEVDRKDALKAFDARVLHADPQLELYHPYILEAGERGPFTNANARAQFIGLTHHTTFVDLVRAVYDGLVLAARDCYAAMGSQPEEIRIAGGAARSKALKLLLASAMGVPVRESAREESGAAGAAMMAAVAIGAVPDMAVAVEKWVKPCLRGTVQPDAQLKARYDQLFPIYVKARQAMPPVWADLAAARNRTH
ncbi:FGGY-family carbohydrate kinase [Dongia deserti]|uniref:FGGY-family carbohydrate kinase n=1 Tax=Dongia deserti TaxID=2268030 RepID=UPI0025481EF0|nr:FGGY-family carbohydrate kinase [Dongia deserti]